jgi:hypothetical protein
VVFPQIDLYVDDHRMKETVPNIEGAMGAAGAPEGGSEGTLERRTPALRCGGTMLGNMQEK